MKSTDVEAATLLTPRLRLRPFTLDDVPDLYSALYSDAEVMRYLPGGVPRSMEQTRQVIESFMKHWNATQFGAWAIIHRADESLIGQCGLNRLREDGSVEIFYAIARRYWGQGITPEAAQAVLDYGFNVAKLPQIIAVAVPENTASRRVMEKIGMTFNGISTAYYNGASLALYAISSAEWKR